jgi:hypothetical protein
MCFGSSASPVIQEPEPEKEQKWYEKRDAADVNAGTAQYTYVSVGRMLDAREGFVQKAVSDLIAERDEAKKRVEELEAAARKASTVLGEVV